MSVYYLPDLQGSGVNDSGGAPHIASSGVGSVLTKDSDWAALDGLLCEVTKFTPLAKIENGRVVAVDRSMPYAFIDITCSEGGVTLPQDTSGAIVHKVDFSHLWTAFIDRGLGENEKLFIVWSKRNLRSATKLLSSFMPRLAVLIFQDDGYELLSNKDYRPELSGMARWEAMKPVLQLQPEVWN
jgi:hypothetical protein